MGATRILCLASIFSILTNTQSEAALLNLIPDSNKPDITSSFLNVSYDSSSEVFSATGYSDQYWQGGVPMSVGPYSYTLTANITSAGMLTSGSLTINGDIGSGEQTLLAGDLTAFGFMDTPNFDLFEFRASITGGTLSGDFGGNLGVILDANFGGWQSTPFDGTWMSSFYNNGSSGYADNFMVAPTNLRLYVLPEPGSNLLVLVGVAVCAAAHRCCRRTKHPRSDEELTRRSTSCQVACSVNSECGFWGKLVLDN